MIHHLHPAIAHRSGRLFLSTCPAPVAGGAAQRSSSLLPKGRAYATQQPSLAWPCPSSPVHQSHHRCVALQAAALDSSDLQEDELQGVVAGEEDELLDLPMPDTRHQRQLDMKAIKALRSRANTAAKEKTLINVQVGQNGITQAVLSTCADVLSKHELVRVRLGEGCGLERGSAARQLASLLDAVCVHQIGFTVTLYREQGLPRPSNCPTNSAPPQQLQAEAAQDAQSEAGTSAARSSQLQGKGKGKGSKQSKRRQPKEQAESLPPEFSVL